LKIRRGVDIPMNEHIVIPTDITKKPYWLDKPFGKGQALLDLIMMADIAGQIVVSVKDLAYRWGWGDKKASLFLTYLEKEKIIKYSSKRSLGTLILIVNYKKYLKKEQTGEKHSIKMRV